MGGSGSAPWIHSAKLTPLGAVQSLLLRRRHTIAVSSTRLAQLLAGSAVIGPGRVRGGSVRSSARVRVDTQPVRSPNSIGEFANVAIITGPSACSAAQRAATRCGSPASRQTCTPAVLHIINRPSSPVRSKAVSIAA